MPSIFGSCLLTIPSIIKKCIQRWISTAEVFLQRKFKQFRLSASERERKSRNLNYEHFSLRLILQTTLLLPATYACRKCLSVRLFTFETLLSSLKSTWELMLHREANLISTGHFSHRWIKYWFRLRTSDVKPNEPAVIVWFLPSFFIRRPK